MYAELESYQPAFDLDPVLSAFRYCFVVGANLCVRPYQGSGQVGVPTNHDSFSEHLYLRWIATADSPECSTAQSAVNGHPSVGRDALPRAGSVGLRPGPGSAKLGNRTSTAFAPGGASVLRVRRIDHGARSPYSRGHESRNGRCTARTSLL